ncbi:type VI secretion system baseplate subunit TssF [Nereida sp. MMG025]|uniref:type VI secretion system baseplate subunit TssF n=1 Tax=Nereida sp. MMG025 TaxID=2909981 RepID=UPI001F00218A|nr:type VI secretion system baseplate subunit TssF [Nereida sp. MMG025]MCF6445709.1 type VI secretion system baseplate subunit TssF [Nereida sp. MMG025]
MKKDFKEAYERELLLLKERAAQFAKTYPGLADRLGGLLEENLDPSIAGLLEGSAFLAARVQLNIDQQFRTFSNELLEQVNPEMTAPLASAILVEGSTPEKPADLIKGRTLEAGSYIEATFSEASRRVACRFRLAEPITFWPIALPAADYHATATPLNALGCDNNMASDHSQRTAAGLVISFKNTAETPFSTLQADSLPVHFTGPIQEAQALYEQIFSRLLRVSLRWEDNMGTPIFHRIPNSDIQQVGFDSENSLYGRDERLFPGVSTLLEFFAFPRKFLGFRIANLTNHIKGVTGTTAQLVFEFDQPNKHLKSHFDQKNLTIFCAPAVNLFEDDAKPIALDSGAHKHLVAPNRTPNVNYEVQRILDVRAQYDAARDKMPVHPLYGIPSSSASPRQALYYTSEREKRSLSQSERRVGGTRFRYEGTETWITFYEPPEADPANLLFVKTLCSNRHLPEVLPLLEATFHLLDNRIITFKLKSGPTAPREAVADLENDGPHRMKAGDNYWRLISLISLSYRGFTGAHGKGDIDAVREVLRLFSDVSDQLTDSQINALTDIKVRPRTRTIKRPDGFHPARGMEITLVFDEYVMEPAVMITMSAALDRFFADYAAVNSFTQCIVTNSKNQILKTWPPRGGSGPLL